MNSIYGSLSHTASKSLRQFIPAVAGGEGKECGDIGQGQGQVPPISFSPPKHAILAPYSRPPSETSHLGPPNSLYSRKRGSWPPVTFPRPKHAILAPTKLAHGPAKPFWPGPTCLKGGDFLIPRINNLCTHAPIEAQLRPIEGAP